MLILLSVQWLTRTAYELLAAGGRRPEALGADDMFPLLVNVLAHSNIPCIHLIMVLHCAALHAMPCLVLPCFLVWCGVVWCGVM